MGARMRISFGAALLSIAVSAIPAKAEPPNNTPHALACMKKYGFTYAEWRAYTVPAAKAEPYRKSRDAGAKG
jgi:hypothetical protein